MSFLPRGNFVRVQVFFCSRVLISTFIASRQQASLTTLIKLVGSKEEGMVATKCLCRNKC